MQPIINVRKLTLADWHKVWKLAELPDTHDVGFKYHNIGGIDKFIVYGDDTNYSLVYEKEKNSFYILLGVETSPVPNIFKILQFISEKMWIDAKIIEPDIGVPIIGKFEVGGKTVITEAELHSDVTADEIIFFVYSNPGNEDFMSDQLISWIYLDQVMK